MFVTFRHVYRTCDKIIIRTIRGRDHFIPKGQNPGLDHRLRAFQKEGLPINDDDAEEFVEQSESDFSKVGEAYNEHMNETFMGKYEVRHRIVKDKYFKEHMPNLLTWSEKEQIRHLHQEHPDEWTLEKLAESFPVTVPVLKILIKYPWKPATEQRIARHDASVMRNWRELKEGSLDISKDIKEHFLKFSDRTIPPLKKESIKIDLTQAAKIGEFESIVKRCADNEQARSTMNSNETKDNPAESTDVTVKDVKVRKDNKVVTLEELTAKLKTRIEKGRKIDLPDQIILNTVNPKINTTGANVTSDIELSNVAENKIAEYKEDSNEKSIMDYPERIRIPKKAYKRGATYKVNDCYYDHDGHFLYRVLGMTS